MKGNKYQMILVADLHFGAGNDDRLNQEVNDILLKKIRKERKTLDLVEFLGDCSHRQLGMNEKSAKYQANLFMAVNKLSMKYGFAFRVIKGTLRHDYNQLELYRKLELINPNFKIINTVEVDVVNPEIPIKILQIPEEYVDDQESYYKKYLNVNDDDKYDFTMVHGTFDFAGYVAKLSNSERQMKNAPTFKSKDFEDINYGCTFSGHVHTQMDKNNVFYIGSFSRFAFGEEEPKGFYEVFYDLETLETEINFIENTKAPTYITIDIDKLPKDIKKRMKYIQKFQEEYDYIRIKTKETLDNQADLEMLKQFSKSDDNLKVEITHKESEETDHTFDFLFDDKKSKMDKMIEFAKIKLGETITKEDILEVFQETDLKDKIKDLLMMP